ncbi:MAG: HAD-IIIA family hydrolase [Candidatus Korobacteraceae bacterium]
MGRDRAPDFSGIEYVFLDRDGVLNRKPAGGGFVTRWEELELLPKAPEAIAVLNRSQRTVIVVTNQRGIALGLFSQDDLERLHDRLCLELSTKGAHLDGIYVCPHDRGQCNCRKPLTGLFAQAFADFPEARPDNSVMVGDSLSDIEAGYRLGMRTVLIADATDTSTPEMTRAAALAQASLASLAEFVERLGCDF